MFLGQFNYTIAMAFVINSYNGHPGGVTTHHMSLA